MGWRFCALRDPNDNGMSMQTKTFTVTDLTRRWRCSRDRVIALIERRQLRAVRLPGGTKRKYAIQPEAVEAFENGREIEEQERLASNARAREARRRNRGRSVPRYF